MAPPSTKIYERCVPFFECFFTTIAIDIDSDHCLVATGCLIDSGASAHSISRELVEKLDLEITVIEPIGFRLADKSVVFRDGIVKVPVWLAGVRARLTAFINDNAAAPFTFGFYVTDQFRLETKPLGVGERCVPKVTVCWDIKYWRTTKYLVTRDTNRRNPRMMIVSNLDEQALIAKEGETTQDQKNRLRVGCTRVQWRRRFSGGKTPSTAPRRVTRTRRGAFGKRYSQTMFYGIRLFN